MLNELNDILVVNQKSLKDFPQLPQFDEYPGIGNTLNENRLLIEELSYGTEELSNVLKKHVLLTSEQQSITQSVLHSVQNGFGQCFFWMVLGGQANHLF